MSALLDVDACSINLLAEYGFASRQFSKTPRVYQSTNYTSCLFLKYQQRRYIPNRIQNYRNHFTLYTNDKTVVIARVETTLNHVDNDAVICYDVITPSDDINCRMRSSYKNWDVSFDEITYSSECEHVIDYELQCHGEWYYFDRGIILNGITAFQANSPCFHLLIYYELHVEHKITLPCSNSIINLVPSIGVIYNPNDVTKKKKKSGTSSNTPSNTPSHTPPAGGSSPTHPSSGKSKTILTSNLSTLLLPHLNSNARSVVTTNDSTQPPRAKHSAVMPSLSWFEERQKELCRSDLSYFLPISAECYVNDGKLGSNLLYPTTWYPVSGNGFTPFPELPAIFGSSI